MAGKKWTGNALRPGCLEDHENSHNKPAQNGEKEGSGNADGQWWKKRRPKGITEKGVTP